MTMKSYGSFGDGGGGSDRSSPQPQHPIHLHPTLDALDVGPHAFRNSTPQSQSESPDTNNQRRLQCLSMPATLHSPLLRRNFSSPGDKMKASNELTLPQAFDPSLNVPKLQDTFVQVDENTIEEASKSESKPYICDHVILSRLERLASHPIILKSYSRLCVLRHLCIR
jgi:hypothetical protein